MIEVGCHSCHHRFQRAAAQVLADGRCPQCSSTDIDLASNVSVAAKTAIGPNPFCASGLHSECSGFMCDCPCHAYTVSPAVSAALTEPTDSGVPGGQTCPGCGAPQYDGDSCSKCGYTPDDGVYAKLAGHGDPGFCEVCGQAIRPGANKGSFVHYDSALELAHQAEPNEATRSWYSENAPEYLASRREAKLREITDSVLGSNPGMSRKTASSIAEETIRRYPKVVG